MASRSIEFDVVANDKASGKLRGVEAVIGELGQRIGKMFTATALFDRALGYLEQGMSAFLQTVKDTAALKDQAAAAGLTTDEYQRLAIAAQDAGLSQEQMMKGLKTMKEALRDARIEGSQQARVLLALGYSQKQITDGSIDAMDAMYKLSGAVQAATTPQEKYNIAASIFGTKAQELIPLLDGFRDAMNKAAKEDIISERNIQRLDEAEKRIEKMQRRLKTFSMTALAEQGPAAAASLINIPTAGTAQGVGGLLANIAGAALKVGEGSTAPAPITQADKDAAAALGKLGKTAASGGSAGMAGVSTAQSLGMATSVALAQQQTSYLATIAANTSPSMGGAIPGRTNFTRPDATRGELDSLARDIRFGKSVPAYQHQRPAR